MVSRILTDWKYPLSLPAVGRPHPNLLNSAVYAFNSISCIKWRPIAPKAVKCIEKDLEELFNFYSCPKAMWIKLRTTNVIERAFREVRRRTRTMSCFNHDQSIERIVYAVLNHLNEQWGKKPLKEFTQKN